jgi:L-histidine Nalpha-methyltransferase
MSTQRSAALATPEARSAFALDVAASLVESPRRVSSQYLYDALGSALFDAICELPWYRVTRAELSLLQRYGAAILGAAGPIGRVVELGAGSGAKLSTLLRQRSHTGAPRVSLIDVSATALASAARALGEIRGLGPLTMHENPYEEGLEAVARETSDAGPTLLLLLGSNIGNFNPEDGHDLLCRIRRSLRSGDQFLIGTDLVKPEAALQLAYDDPIGVTAAFNLNVCARINRELGANFDLRRLRHVAVWNAEASRVEMHIESTVEQSISVPAAGLRFTLRAGERIWTESSYKYTTDDVEDMLASAGFRLVQPWIDRDAGFALTLASAM